MDKSATIGVIYKATCVPTGLVYVGQTTQKLKKRKQQHFQSVHKPRTRFSTAIKQWGKDAFEWDIIDTAYSIKELDDKEEYWIKHYNSTKKTQGYNIQEGGTKDKIEWANKRLRIDIERTINAISERHIEAKDLIEGAINAVSYTHIEKRRKYEQGIATKIKQRQKMERDLEHRVLLEQSMTLIDKMTRKLRGQWWWWRLDDVFFDMFEAFFYSFLFTLCFVSIFIQGMIILIIPPIIALFAGCISLYDYKRKLSA